LLSLLATSVRGEEEEDDDDEGSVCIGALELHGLGACCR
jgi:hypothetical protein